MSDFKFIMLSRHCRAGFSGTVLYLFVSHTCLPHPLHAERCQVTHTPFLSLTERWLWGTVGEVELEELSSRVLLRCDCELLLRAPHEKIFLFLSHAYCHASFASVRDERFHLSLFSGPEAPILATLLEMCRRGENILLKTLFVMHILTFPMLSF